MKGDGAAEADKPALREEPDALEREIAGLRQELDGLVRELDRRRHEAFDWRLQLQRHRRTLLFGAAGLAVLVIGGVAFSRARSARRMRPAARAQRLGHALQLAMRDPDKLVRALEQRPAPRTSALSVLGSGATAAARMGIERALRSR